MIADRKPERRPVHFVQQYCMHTEPSRRQEVASRRQIRYASALAQCPTLFLRRTALPSEFTSKRG
jgi:hypothetical protein